MKKVLSVLIVAVMIITMCAAISVNATDSTATLHGWSFNTFFFNGTGVWCDVGDGLGFLKENPFIFSNVDIPYIGIRGWAWIDNSTIDLFGYSIDGGERVYDAAYLENRPDVYDTTFHVTADVANGYSINPVDISTLAVGPHIISAYVKAADGTEIKIVDVPFGIPGGNTWLCDSTPGIMPGYWLNSTEDFITLTFKTTKDFWGFCTMFYASGATNLLFSVLNDKGRVLDTLEAKGVVEGVAITKYFSRSFGPGTYTLKIQATSFTPNAQDMSYAVLATSTPVEAIPVTIGGQNSKTNPADWNAVAGTALPDNANAAPFMFLVDGYPTTSLKAMSFDNIFVDGTQLCNGDAPGYLKDHPVKGDVKSIGLRGWAWINTSTIKSFGYAIDDGEAVFDAAYIEDRADVYDTTFHVTADVANGYKIQNIDVSKLGNGEHVITVYVKGADGGEAEVTSATFTVKRPYELLGVSYDELLYDGKQLASESVYKKLADLDLDFDEGETETITVRGWVRISENAADIAAFGYSIDGADPVFGEFVQDRVTELANATGVTGGQGFKVDVPVAGLKEGKHTIDVYVKATDGTVLKVIKNKEGVDYQVGVTFNVNKPEETPVNPGTSDAAVIAIAAVSVVALAGAFIGKKALKK